MTVYSKGSYPFKDLRLRGRVVRSNRPHLRRQPAKYLHRAGSQWDRTFESCRSRSFFSPCGVTDSLYKCRRASMTSKIDVIIGFGFDSRRGSFASIFMVLAFLRFLSSMVQW